MARHELPKEDLICQATALVERVEFATDKSIANALQVNAASPLQSPHTPIVVGFRTNGAASFFFGDDPVYQFNSQHAIRRAFVGGDLYKAEQGMLVRLRRDRGDTDGQPHTQLRRAELDESQAQGFIENMNRWLSRLRDDLQSDRLVAVRQIPEQIPEQADLTHRVLMWLAALPASPQVAARPHA